MAVVGVAVSLFLVLVFFYVRAMTVQGNRSIRYEDNATTAAGGTFLHQRSAKMYPKFVN